LSTTEKPPQRFKDFLSREAAVQGLNYREKLATMRHHLDQAPILRPLSNLWSGPGAVLFGVWANPSQLAEQAELQGIDFLGADLPDGAEELKLIRRVKLKVDKPFVISVNEADEYRIYQVRALGGDAVLLTVSRLKAVELQYLIEFGRDLGLQSVLWCEDDEDLTKASETDARIIAGPACLQASLKTRTDNWLTILFIESVAEVSDLSQTDRAIGVMLKLENFKN